ncbi:MAG TPA: hypothetical protein VK348_05405, partial [Planctomycetota bacterium]|nr:hypothetical protein [Planctomycetota bacterium]
GVNSLGAPAQVAGRVNGVQVSIPTAPGMGAAAASAAHQAAFAAAGFATVRVNANLFCVTAGPGGALITSGLCYGTDDMGFDLDSSVALIPPVGGGPAAPGVKPGGVVVPVPPVQQPPRPVTGSITICFDVWVFGVRVRICITITLAANLNGQQLQQSILQQLVAQGFRGNFVKVRNPLAPTQLIDALQVDRTIAGDVVDGVEYQYDALSRQILPQLTGAGVLPEFGGTEYGVATQGNAPTLPWSHLQGQPPRINSFFDVFHEVELPNLPGGIAINLTAGAFPVLNGLLLVNPLGAVFEPGVSNSTGTLHRGWTVPGSGSLIGLPICEQGGVIDGSGTVSMSTGIRAVIGS